MKKRRNHRGQAPNTNKTLSNPSLAHDLDTLGARPENSRESNGRKVERSDVKFQELLAAVETESSRTHLEEFAEQWGLSWKPREVML